MTVSDKAVEAAARALAAHDCLGGPNWDFANEHWQGFAGSAEAALEAAAPHMLPAPEGVSEAEKALHDLCSWLDQWDRRDNDTAKNIRTVLSALSSERERAERAERERDWLETTIQHDHLLSLKARAVQAEFLLALALECARENKERAPMFGVAEGVYAVAIRRGDQQEARAQAAEAKVKEGAELLDAFGRMLNEDHDNLPDELVVSLTYDDTDYDDDLGGPNTLLGELFLRVFRNARSAALRWTEEASQGEGE